MRRATTPKIEIQIDESLIDCWYRITFAQRNGNRIIKDQDDCELSEDGKTILVSLTQEETLRFTSGHNIRIQVRFGQDGQACATNIAEIKVTEILDEEVI